MNIYVDIDGVLLTKDKSVPKGADLLLPFLARVHSCYWLTTHCRNGENRALGYISSYYPSEYAAYFNRFKPAYWETLKTEAIDKHSSFLWLEDYPLEAEMNVLRKAGRLDALIKVDLARDPDQLLSIYQTLSE